MNRLKSILSNLALTILAIHLSILGAWFFYIILFVDTTQPLEHYDTLLSFFETFYLTVNNLLTFLVSLITTLQYN